MPKQKTHRASAKRFKRTGSGGLKRFRAFTSHRFHGLKNNVVTFVKRQWYIQVTLNVSNQCFHKCVNPLKALQIN